MDENGDKRIQFHEFTTALEENGVSVNEVTASACFDEMDREGNGVVNFDEFLIALRVSVIIVQ